MVDINSATGPEIAAALGLSLATGERIVAARQRLGGFRRPDDLVASAELQPHELVRVRDKAVFGAFHPTKLPPHRRQKRTRRRSRAAAGFLISYMSDRLRIGAVSQTTDVEGPGRRFAIWSQGCSIRCSGCFNPHLWGNAGGRSVLVADLAGDALKAGVEGITLLGGEPFDQAGAFAALAKLVRAGGLSVMTFSGYYLGQLLALDAPSGAQDLLDQHICS